MMRMPNDLSNFFDCTLTTPIKVQLATPPLQQEAATELAKMSLLEAMEMEAQAQAAGEESEEASDEEEGSEESGSGSGSGSSEDEEGEDGEEDESEEEDEPVLKYRRFAKEVVASIIESRVDMQVHIHCVAVHHKVRGCLAWALAAMGVTLDLLSLAFLGR